MTAEAKASEADPLHSHPRVTPGRVVFYSDGLAEYPGIVTHVHNEGCVNIFVFPDGSYPERASGPRTSVTYHAPSERVGYPGSWRWPKRTG